MAGGFETYLDIGEHFKNLYQLLNLRAFTITMPEKNDMFRCMGKIIDVEFQRSLWNSTQNNLSVHWKMYKTRASSEEATYARGPVLLK